MHTRTEAYLSEVPPTPDPPKEDPAKQSAEAEKRECVCPWRTTISSAKFFTLQTAHFDIYYQF